MNLRNSQEVIAAGEDYRLQSISAERNGRSQSGKLLYMFNPHNETDINVTIPIQQMRRQRPREFKEFAHTSIA